MLLEGSEAFNDADRFHIVGRFTEYIKMLFFRVEVGVFVCASSVICWCCRSLCSALCIAISARSIHYIKVQRTCGNVCVIRYGTVYTSGVVFSIRWVSKETGVLLGMHCLVRSKRFV